MIVRDRTIPNNQIRYLVPKLQCSVIIYDTGIKRPTPFDVVVEHWSCTDTSGEGHWQLSCTNCARKPNLSTAGFNDMNYHTRRIDVAEDNLRKSKATQFSRIKLLDDRIGVFNQAVV